MSEDSQLPGSIRGHMLLLGGPVGQADGRPGLGPHPDLPAQEQTIVVVDYNVRLVQAPDLHRPGRRNCREHRTQGPLRRPQHRSRASPRRRSWPSSMTMPKPSRIGSSGSAAMYDDPDVLAVGGRVEPLWEAGRPGHFANELDWIVGCTYRGMPKVAAEVRNVIGANMSFRAEVLDRVRRIQHNLGTPGRRPTGLRRDRTVHPRGDWIPRIPGGL